MTVILQERDVPVYPVDGRDLPAHPFAECLPLMPGAELQVLCEDIREYGQLEPVVLARIDSNDFVVDGRNRLLACARVDIRPKTIYLDQERDLPMYILSKNRCRRHLRPSQWAMVGARLTTLRKAGRPPQTALNDAISQRTAGRMVGVGRSAIQHAAAILEDEVLAPAVDNGIVAVSDAHAIKDWTDAEKRRALKSVRDGEVPTLRAALACTAAPDVDGAGTAASARPKAAERTKTCEGRVHDSVPHAGGDGTFTAKPPASVRRKSDRKENPDALEPTAAAPGAGVVTGNAEPGKKASSRKSSASSGESLVADLTSLVIRLEAGEPATLAIDKLKRPTLGLLYGVLEVVATGMVTCLEEEGGSELISALPETVILALDRLVKASRSGVTTS